MFIFSGPVKNVRLGELDYSRTYYRNKIQNFNIAKVFKHPDYNNQFYRNDIALLKLHKPVTINKYVTPICLNTEEDFNTSQAYFLIAGWGEIGNGNDIGSSHLRKATVEIFTHEECNKFYPEVIEKLHFCAGSHTGESNTCEVINSIL